MPEHGGNRSAGEKIRIMIFKINFRLDLFLLFTFTLLYYTYGYISDTSIYSVDTSSNDTLINFKKGTVLYELGRNVDNVTIAVPCYFRIADFIKNTRTKDNYVTIEIINFIPCFADSLFIDTVGYLKNGAHKLARIRCSDIINSNMNIEALINNDRPIKSDVIFDVPLYPFLVNQDWPLYIRQLINNSKLYHSSFEEILPELETIFAHYPTSFSDSVYITTKDNFKYIELYGNYTIGPGHFAAILIFNDNQLEAIWNSQELKSAKRIKLSKGYLYFYNELTNLQQVTDFIETNWLNGGIGAPIID